MAINTQKLLLEIQVKNQQALGRVEKDVNRLANSNISLSKAANAAVASLAALGAVRIAKAIVNTTARFEDLRTSLSAVTGSAEAGTNAFRDITKFATKTQFGVEDLTKTFIKLKASGIEPTEELLTTFTDTAAITTDQIGTLEAITALFSRTVSGGLGLEELNRLEDRGVPVFRILKEQLGITRLEISEFGKTAEGARQITEAFAKGIRQQYGGATAKVVGNLSTQFSNFQIALRTAADDFGQYLAPEIKKATQEITKFIEENKDGFPEAARQVTEFSKTVIKLTKDVGAGLKDLYNLADRFGLGELGILGFLLVGKKGKVAIVALSGLITFLKNLNEKMKETAEQAENTGDAMQSPDDEFNAFRYTVKKTDDELDNTIKIFYDFEETVTDASGSIKYMGVTLGETIAYYDDFNTTALLTANNLAQIKKEEAELVANFKKTFAGQALVGLDNYNTKLKEIIKNYQTATIVTDTLVAATKAFETTATNSLTDVIMGTKTLEQALGEIGQAILRELVAGFIKIAIVGPILEKIADVFGFDLASAALKAARAEAEINKQLQKQIKLRLLLMLLGFANGGKIGFGSSGGGGDGDITATEGSFANGGKIGFKGFRAGGGGVASGAYMVGERGPELFVPSSAGTIIPNHRMNSSGMGTTINFNINAVDASGFDELLLSRKGLIIGTIQQAMRGQGRKFA